MADRVRIFVDGKAMEVQPGTTAAAAVALSGASAFRRSVSGEPRGPLCGMGICFECRVTIDGQPHRLSCQTLCADGMEIRTDA